MKYSAHDILDLHSFSSLRFLLGSLMIIYVVEELSSLASDVNSSVWVSFEVKRGTD